MGREKNSNFFVNRVMFAPVRYFLKRLSGVNGRDRSGEEDAEQIKDMLDRIENLIRTSSEKTELFRIISENAPIGIALYSDKIEYVNPAIEKITGYSREEIIGKEVKFLMGGMEDRVQESLLNAVKERLKGKQFKNEFQTRIRTKDGQLKDIWVISNTAKLSDRYLGLGIVLDITQIKDLERRLNELLDKDELTGLLSRFGFTRKVGELLEEIGGKGEKSFLMIVDISRFKVINDTYGHRIGDRLLKKLAERFRNVLHPADLIGRIAADEFGIFVAGQERFNQMASVIDSVIEAVEETIVIEDYRFNLTCSIGVSVFPDDGEDVDTLLKRADIALIRAKEKFLNTQRSSVVFFSKELEDKITRRLELERELRCALKYNPDEFYVEYQPICSLDNFRIEKLEALIRWNSARFGKLPPPEFIHIAEETGLIKQLTAIVFERVIADMNRWREEGLDPKVSINISPAEFKDSDFTNRIVSRLKPYGLERSVCIEITENVLLEDVEDATEKLKTLRAEGIQVLLDDFGTGYSSLTYLKRFPISILKIDREFIRELPENEDDRGIVITIIQLSQLLSIDAVAEGIEKESQVVFLKDIGCKYGQGYYFSRPVPPEVAEELLKKGRI